jgi:hypothetical protein
MELYSTKKEVDQIKLELALRLTELSQAQDSLYNSHELIENLNK